MRIAFVSEYPPDRVELYGGIPYYMSRAVKEASDFFQYVKIPVYDWGLAMKGGNEALSELKKRGRDLSKILSKIDAEAVLFQGSAFSAIPYLDTEKKVALWGDATWFTLMNEDFDVFRIKHPFLHHWDCLLLEKCDLIGFAAEWVCELTIQHYQTPAGKICILPFGANLDETISLETVSRIISDREQEPCQLTFLGIDWERKGLPLAFEVLNRLNLKGLSSKLNVIGCDIPKVGLWRKIENNIGFRSFKAKEHFQVRFNLNENVNKLGFLNKNNPAQYSLICETLRKTHFLLHPAHFECFGIALVEANAFGVPVLATNNHGPKSIIRNCVNGRLYEHDDYIDKASDFIEKNMSDYQAYNSLAFQSFHEYRNRFDWSVIVQNFKNLLYPK